MSTANPLWGAPRIHGELQKLGIAVSESTVAKYMRQYPRPPSQRWRTFLANHVSQIMAADLFVVPTMTFRLLFVLVILAHDRRRIAHVAVTAHPTAAWTAQQLRNAFPENEAPRYLLHDRDSVFAHVATTLEGMNIQEVRTAPRSPWQNAYMERIIGSIRRECHDHVIVVNTASLHCVLTDYLAYSSGPPSRQQARTVAASKRYTVGPAVIHGTVWSAAGLRSILMKSCTSSRETAHLSPFEFDARLLCLANIRSSGEVALAGPSHV